MNGTTSGHCPPRQRSRSAGVLVATAAGGAMFATAYGGTGGSAVGDRQVIASVTVLSPTAR
ncbi:MAG: hypothetical protein ACLQDY_08480 [Streptosporangiaceae bacterium]